jgi:hypothetical protein
MFTAFTIIIFLVFIFGIIKGAVKNNNSGNSSSGHAPFNDFHQSATPQDDAFLMSQQSAAGNGNDFSQDHHTNHGQGHSHSSHDHSQSSHDHSHSHSAPSDPGSDFGSPTHHH